MQDAIEQGDIGPEPWGEVDVGGRGGRRRPWVDDDQFRRLRPGEPVEDPHPEHRLVLGEVAADEEQAVGGVEVGVRARLAVGAERFPEGLRRRCRAQPGVAVELAGADPGMADDREGVVLLEESWPVL
jgi:hypothetical protein